MASFEICGNDIDLFDFLDDNEESSPGTMHVESNLRQLPFKIDFENDMKNKTPSQ